MILQIATAVVLVSGGLLSLTSLQRPDCWASPLPENSSVSCQWIAVMVYLRYDKGRMRGMSIGADSSSLHKPDSLQQSTNLCSVLSSFKHLRLHPGFM